MTLEELEAAFNTIATQVIIPLQEQVKKLTAENKKQQELIDQHKFMYDEWLTGEGKFASAGAPKRKTHTRKPLNREDYDRVQALCNEGKLYADIAAATGIPNTTVRKYLKMEDAERDALPSLAPVVGEGE